MTGVLYVIEQLGVALQQANQVIEKQQQRIAELEAQLKQGEEAPQ